jgi:hypothetical protein
VSGGTGSAGNPDLGAGDGDAAHDPGRSNVLDPQGFTQGDEQRVDFDGNDPTGNVEGTTSGQGLQNLPLVPYTDRFTAYQQQALGALDRMSIPSSLQDIVRIYFTELGGQ